MEPNAASKEEARRGNQTGSTEGTAALPAKGEFASPGETLAECRRLDRELTAAIRLPKSLGGTFYGCMEELRHSEHTLARDAIDDLMLCAGYSASDGKFTRLSRWYSDNPKLSPEAKLDILRFRQIQFQALVGDIPMSDLLSISSLSREAQDNICLIERRDGPLKGQLVIGIPRTSINSPK